MPARKTAGNASEKAASITPDSIFEPVKSDRRDLKIFKVTDKRKDPLFIASHPYLSSDMAYVSVLEKTQFDSFIFLIDEKGENIECFRDEDFSEDEEDIRYSMLSAEINKLF